MSIVWLLVIGDIHSQFLPVVCDSELPLLTNYLTEIKSITDESGDSGLWSLRLVIKFSSGVGCIIWQKMFSKLVKMQLPALE